MTVLLAKIIMHSLFCLFYAYSHYCYIFLLFRAPLQFMRTGHRSMFNCLFCLSVPLLYYLPFTIPELANSTLWYEGKYHIAIAQFTISVL
jgi:hypothetical protein